MMVRSVEEHRAPTDAVVHHTLHGTPPQAAECFHLPRQAMHARLADATAIPAHPPGHRGGGGEPSQHNQGRNQLICAHPPKDYTHSQGHQRDSSSRQQRRSQLTARDFAAPNLQPLPGLGHCPATTANTYKFTPICKASSRTSAGSPCTSASSQPSPRSVWYE